MQLGGILLVIVIIVTTVVSETANETCVTDVLVLGAGMAGVKAAADIYDGGLRVLVLEQADRIGGRMWQIPWEGQVIELGANWIEGIPQKENPIWTIARELDLKGNYTDQEDGHTKPVLFDQHGRVPKAEADELHARLDRALNGAKNQSCLHHFHNLGDLSLRDAMTQGGWPRPEDQTPLERTLEFFVVDWDFQFPPENVSSYNFFSVGHSDSWRETCKKNPPLLAPSVVRAKTAARMGMLGNFSWESPRFFVTDPRGYAAVAEHIGRRLTNRSSHMCPHRRSGFVFKSTVSSIRYRASSCEVETADGLIYTARFCISTFSSGVVNAAVASSALFEPLLPEWKANAFLKAQNGIYTKIFLQYERAFWEDADYVLYADPHRRGYYAVWQDLESHHKFFPSNASILMVTVVQNDSKHVETQSKSETIREIQTVLKEMYGADIPEPRDIYFPRWHSDPAFQGSWSNIAVGADKSIFSDMQKNLGSLYFAGEATDADFNGFTLGGYTSGQRAAASVLQADGEQ